VIAEILLLAGSSVVGLALVAFATLSLLHGARVRRHLRRLRTMQLEHERD